MLIRRRFIPAASSILFSAFQLVLLLLLAILPPLFTNCATPMMDHHHFSPPTAFASPPLVVEKPFQPKWSNSLGIRRKISRPTGQQRNKENNNDSPRQSTTSIGNLQQLRRPPPPSAINVDDWTLNSGGAEGGEHKIVHLINRPTQLYYFQQEGPELSGGGDTVELGSGQVCRVKVPSSEVFYITYEDGAGIRPSVDLFFHCSQYWAWCCGVDCCQIDPTLLLAGLCICILALAFLVHLCLRSKLGQRLCLDKLFRRRKRVIARANAQRRKRSEGSSQAGGGEMRRIRANSLKGGGTAGGGGHKKLRKASTRDCGDLTSAGGATTTKVTTRGADIPEIVVTEPSSCYEPSCKSGSEMEEEEEDEVYDDDEEEEYQN